MAGVNGKVIPKAAPAGVKVKGKGKEEGRPIAVDWALSKDQWEKTQGKETKNSGSDSDESSGSSSSSGSESEDSESDSEESEEDDEEDDEGEEDGDVPVKPTLPTVDVGSTLFIRNLPFEVTEPELNSL